MLLSKYKSFQNEVKEDKTTVDSCESIRFYHKWENTWFDDSENKEDDEELMSRLDLTLEVGKHWRTVDSRIAYFPIPEFSSVAVVTFPRITQFQTRVKFQKNINLCFDRASKAFDASHDKLTGLLNASSFNELTQSLLVSSFPLEELEESFIEAGPSQSVSVSVIALDIDHFKQVNDTFGHVYGDKVLAVLGRRLETCAQEVRDTYSDKIDKLYVSRPSGEEFLVLVSGLFDIDGFKEVGELFRAVVNKEALPSDKEWESINSVSEMDGEDGESIQPPPLSDRKITVSVGIASVGSRKSLPKSDPVQVLRNRADKALYSAKSGGRNKVRHFDEILNRHGKILEHQESVNVVIIDIGKELNVLKGQEFIVYHPQFTGEVPYMFDDGRTRRALGICPRVPVGRIIAFEIGQEISFCKVEDKQCEGRFEAGSHLEAIPLGSISHLFSGEEFLHNGGFQLSTRGEIASRCEAAEKDGTQVMAAVFSLANEEMLFKERGSAFINKCLAKIFQEIQENFPAEVFILKVKETEFGVVWISDDSDKMLEASNNVIERLENSLHKLPDVRVGLYLGTKTFDIAGDESELSWKWAIDYASFASVSARNHTDQKTVLFTPNTANNLMSFYYKTKQFGKALSDYTEFRKRGINHYQIENHASLCNWSLPNRNDELLLSTSNRAIELNNTNVVMLANAGYFNFWLGNKKGSYERYRSILEIKPDYPFDTPYLVSAADVFLSAYLEDNCDLDPIWIRALIEKAQPAAFEEKRYQLYVNFAKALKTLSEQI